MYHDSYQYHDEYHDTVSISMILSYIDIIYGASFFQTLRVPDVTGDDLGGRLDSTG